MKKFLAAATALALVSACNSGGDTNQAMNEANVTGNEASAGVENAIAESNATPLQKEQALARMKERHENDEKIGKAMKAAKAGLDRNDPAAVREAAGTIQQLSSQASTWFPVGTGPDVGKTDARA